MLFLITIIGCSSNEKSNTKSVVPIVNQEEEIAKEVKLCISEAKKFESVNQSAQESIELWKKWSKTIKKAENNKIDSIKRLGTELRTVLSDIQKNNFKNIRLHYAMELKDKLWEENINVKLIGNDNSTLEFIGVIFANNKNKKDFQDLIRQDVFDLRFKQINYKWSEHDNSYTSYTLNTPDEGKIF